MTAGTSGFFRSRAATGPLKAAFLSDPSNRHTYELEEVSRPEAIANILFIGYYLISVS